MKNSHNPMADGVSYRAIHKRSCGRRTKEAAAGHRKREKNGISIPDKEKKDMSVEVRRGFNSGLKTIEIKGIEKTKENEALAAALVKALLPEIYGDKILINWKNGILVIRYAEDAEQYEVLLEVIESEKKLPPDHSERSLLY